MRMADFAAEALERAKAMPDGGRTRRSRASPPSSRTSTRSGPRSKPRAKAPRVEPTGDASRRGRRVGAIQTGGGEARAKGARVRPASATRGVGRRRRRRRRCVTRPPPIPPPPIPPTPATPNWRGAGGGARQARRRWSGRGRGARAPRRGRALDERDGVPAETDGQDRDGVSSGGGRRGWRGRRRGGRRAAAEAAAKAKAAEATEYRRKAEAEAAAKAEEEEREIERARAMAEAEARAKAEVRPIPRASSMDPHRRRRFPATGSRVRTGHRGQLDDLGAGTCRHRTRLRWNARFACWRSGTATTGTSTPRNWTPSARRSRPVRARRAGVHENEMYDPRTDPKMAPTHYSQENPFYWRTLRAVHPILRRTRRRRRWA